MAMIEATNQRHNGTSAIAVRRWAHQCWTPSFAEPRPIARPIGERICDAVMSRYPAGDPGNPGNQGQRGCRAGDDPAPEIGRLEVEGMARVPDEVSDAVAQVVEQRHGPAEQQQQPNPGPEEILGAFKGLRPGGGGDQPPYEQDRSGAERYARSAVKDRHDGSELPPVDLKVR